MKVAEISRSDGICIVRLATPWGMNSLSFEGFTALRSIFADLAADRAAEAVILTGSGRAFCAGLALDSLVGVESGGVQPEVLRHQFDAALNPLLRQMMDLPKPLVVAVNGTVAGGGIGLALAGDVVLAARNAAFHCAFVPMLGIVPDAGASWLLPNLMGRNKALPMALLGESLTAEEAERAGLIYRAVAPEELEQQALACAGRLMRASAEALHMTRHLFTDALSSDYSSLLDRERDANVALCTRPELAEGVRAFLSKREPDFRALRARETNNA